MGGTSDYQCSSSPLKRRASSMDEPDTTVANIEGDEDVDMVTIPAETLPEGSSGKDDAGTGTAASPAKGTVGVTDDEASDSQAAMDSRGLPIRTGNQSQPLPEANIAKPSQAHHPTDIPPIAEQIKIIQTLIKAFSEKRYNEGDEAYLVSQGWLEKAMALGPSGKPAMGSDLGKVDNSDIIQTVITDVDGSKFVKLKPGVGFDHFELFPEDAWKMITEWHGLADGQIPIKRTAHKTAIDCQGLPIVQFELHPPVFTIHRLWAAHSPIAIEQDLKSQNPPPAVIVHSSSHRYHDFLKQVKGLVRVPLDRKIRLWKVIQTLPTEDTAPQQPGGLSTPADTPDPEAAPGLWPHMLVDVTAFLKLEKDVERDLVDAHDTTHHTKYNGNKSLAMVNLTVDTVLVIDESVNNDFLTTLNPRSMAKDKGPARGTSAAISVKSSSGSGRNSPAPGSITRGRAQKSGRIIGCVGLQNLGNTCYMNSALQCVRSVEELTKYFLTHESEKEINPDNPLSHNGDVARAYSRLLDDIYRDPAPASVVPREFKNTVGRYAPAFSGYGQQDSQEFVGWLLDGLQEDLNRIKKKPYIEKPDSTDDMIGNLAAIQAMADKVWEITKKRDDSVIADLFTGMYQSTLVCPVCSKVSITFDPFTNLTLPLPIANIWSNSKLRFYPLNDAPVEMEVDLNKNSSIKSLKQFVSDRVGVPVERLFAAEAFRNKFFKFYEDLSTVHEEIVSNDLPVIMELEAVPTNVPWSKNKKEKKQKFRSMLNVDKETDTEPETPIWEDPSSKRLVVPLIHRVRAGEKFKKLGEKDQLPAQCIVLTVEEARSEDAIRRKILEKMASLSTWKGFQEADTEADNTDLEIVNNTSSDGDNNVIAKSVEGEDGLVDIKMADDNERPASSAATPVYPKQLKKFNTKRPKWIDPREFLAPELQNLFDMSYYSGSTNIPCGWQDVMDDREYPSLSTRQPKLAFEADSTSPSPGWEGVDDSGDDKIDGSSVRSQPGVVTRMNEESSDDDSDLPAVKNVTLSRPSASRIGGQRVVRGKRGKHVKTYSRKDARKLAKQSKKESKDSHYAGSVESNDLESDINAVENDGPLVRLGEGVVVDWHEPAFDALFGGEEPNEERGMPMWKNMPKLQDPSLALARERRAEREKQGISLDDCLEEFEKEEILSEQDTWYCPRCKEHRRASKKFDLWKTPDILVVHLKRFSSSGFRREKLDVTVDFPIEGLDLTQRVVNKDGKQEIYDLIAIDDHWGGLGGGHYTAFAKNFIDGEWYEYNDTSVSKQTDLRRLITKSAYLLFYRRRSETPLGGPKFQEIIERYNSQATDVHMSDSGEGQRLGQGSSQRGSSSALTGAGPTPQTNRGSGRDRFGNDTEMHDYDPLYLDQNSSDDVMGGGNEDHYDQPRRSIEQDDEGIDVSAWDGMTVQKQDTHVVEGNWSFANIGSGQFADDGDSDIDSTAAQGDGDASSLAGDMEDEEARYAELGGPHPRHVSAFPMEDEVPMVGPEPGAGFVLPDEPNPPGYTVEVTAEELTWRAHGSDVKDERVTEIIIDDKAEFEEERGRSPVVQPKAN